MAEYEFVEHMGGMVIRMFVVTIYKRQTHFHSDIEILMPLEGSVQIDLAGRRSLVHTGDFFIINRNDAHSLMHTQEPNTLLVLQFSPNFAKDYYPQLSHINILQHHITKMYMPRLHDELRTAFAFMLRCMGEHREGFQFELMSALNTIACAIVRYGAYNDGQNDRQAAGEDKVRQRLVGIVDYLQKNFKSGVSLAELARQEGLDMTYLSHFIKDNLGVSFREYVNRLRLECAVDLVLHTKLRMIDVCMECGYSDCRYMNKAFIQEFGMTPAQLRAQGIGAQPTLTSDSGQPGSAEQRFQNLLAVYDRVCSQLETNDISRNKNPFLDKSAKLST